MDSTLNTKKKDFLKTNALPICHNENLNKIMIVQDKNIAQNAKTQENHIFANISGPANTAVLKLLDTAVVYLTCNYLLKGGKKNTEIIKNIYNGDSDMNIVEIPLIEYGEANGYNLKAENKNNPDLQKKENLRANNTRKNFKRNMKKTLEEMLSINYYYNAKDDSLFRKGYLITDVAIYNKEGTDYIQIVFNERIIPQILESALIQHPFVLLKHDNRNQNAYPIGRQIAIHSTMNRNKEKGTANTLKVKTLLSYCNEIPKYEVLQAQGQRTWRTRIKETLETSLQQNIDIGFLQSWQYRDTNTNKILSIKEANKLSYYQYEQLCIDYTIKTKM